MPYCEKDVNQITLNHINLWNLALQIIEALIIILLNVNPWIIPWIKLSWHSCSRWDKRGWLKWFRQFLYEELSSFNLKKDSITHMHGLALYLKERLPFAREISLKNSVDSYLFLTGFASLSVLLLFPLLITFVVMQFLILLHLT